MSCLDGRVLCNVMVSIIEKANDLQVFWNNFCYSGGKDLLCCIIRF